MDRGLQKSQKSFLWFPSGLKITLHESQWIKLLRSHKEIQEQLQRTGLTEYSKSEQDEDVKHARLFAQICYYGKTEHEDKDGGQ